MSADLLREAAELIRHDVVFGQASDSAFLSAVADWLRVFANYAETGENAVDETAAALAVARAYLGRDA